MSVAASPPTLVSWNLTRRCNLRCPHCYLDAVVRSQGGDEEFSTERCLDVVQQLARLAPGCLLILTGGEPLLRSDLPQIARAAADAGLYPVLGTNGILLGEPEIDALSRAGITGLSVSVDSVVAEKHDRFRGRKGAHAATLKSVRLARDRGLQVVVQHSLMPFNATELPAMAQLAYELGAAVLNVFYLVCTGRGEKVTALPAQVYETSLTQLADLRSHWAGRLTIGARCAPQFARVLRDRGEDPGGLAAGCPAGRSYLRIAPNGSVTPCPYMPESAGQLSDSSLTDLWEHAEVMRTLREDRPRGRCGECEYRVDCGGCRARALAETGSLLAEDPICPHQPGPPRPANPALPVVGERPGAAAIQWHDEARVFLERIPAFVRKRVMSRVEAEVARRGLSEVSLELLHELRPAGAAGPFARGSRGSLLARNDPTEH